MPNIPKYDKDTQSALDDYKIGTRIRNNQLTVREKAQMPHLVFSDDARNTYGSFLQGQAEKKLRGLNPDLTDYGVSQVIRLSRVDQPEDNFDDGSGPYRKMQQQDEQRRSANPSDAFPRR